ncbi:MAG: transcriptional regulator [Candidatus Methanomethylophilaceae archaeon]|nr:transcriptional regulator [Candidatus Methanomethylophilaceae archaeon]
MKVPCELIVWYVLPMIRREMAAELVNVHGMSQAEVARRFDVTDAAVSQYMKRKRGGRPDMDEGDPDYRMFMDELRESARRIAEEDADFSLEMCRLCGVFKRSGLLDKAYESQTGQPSPRCSCNPVKTGRCLQYPFLSQMNWLWYRNSWAYPA